MAKKYYWLKLQKDFFKRHDIRIVESMANGKDYVLFYMKLLVESISHEGELRFSETIPYNDDMLSTITNTNIDIVRSAVKIFCELDLMNVMDNGTLYMNEVKQMVGAETEWAEKKRLYRDKKTLSGQKRTLSDKSKSIEVDKEIELDIDKEKKAKPSKHKHGEYNHVLLTDSEYKKLDTEWGSDKLNNVIRKLDEGIEMKGYKYKSHYLALRKWEKNEKNQGNGKPDNFKGEVNFDF